jgi:hypothetical protein
MKKFFSPQPGESAFTEGAAEKALKNVQHGQNPQGQGLADTDSKKSSETSNESKGSQEKDSELKSAPSGDKPDPSRLTGGSGFEWALQCLKDGYRVTREGWNGKGMFIYQTVGNTVPKDFIPKFASLPDSVKKFLTEKGEDVVFNSSITLYNAQGQMQPGWAPSQGDLTANDYVVL